jgi:aspartyl protease
MSRVLTTLAWSVAALSACAAAAGAQHGDGHPRMSPLPVAVEVPAAGITLPMQDFGGRPVVDVRVNGKGPYRFILDTGASMTVIDAALKAELKLPPVPGMHAAAPGHGPAPEIVSVESLGVGGATLRGVTAALMPLGQLLTGPQAPRGVLSASVFPGHLVTLDYPSRRVLLKRGSLERADSTTTHAYPEDDPVPTVPIRIAGRETRVHLDTGSGAGLMLPVRYLEELPLASKPQPGGTAKIHGGEVAVTKARVDGPITIGRYTLDPADVSFADIKPGFGPPRGNIGYQVLRNFVVTLDSRNRLVRLVR